MSCPSPITDRAEALLAAPAGCVLLLIAEEYGLGVEVFSQPHSALFVMATAVEQVNPRQVDHDRVVQAAFAHRHRLRGRALELVSHPGVAWWWSPIDRDHQLWLPRHDGFICEHEVWELRPRGKPGPFERYAHEPRPLVSTANAYGRLSPEIAHRLAGAGDRALMFPSHSRFVTIQPRARVLEITSAQDWHNLVRQYPAAGFHETAGDENQPWGYAPNLMVPDWRAVSFDWDGVHITPWAWLTATQVRVTSEIGWTEPWAWEGAHTIWLDWMFDTVSDAPPIETDTFAVPHYPVGVLHPTGSSGSRRVLPSPVTGRDLRGVVRNPFGTTSVKQDG